jgi:hypothetical protein
MTSWLNLRDYTVVELSLFGAGGALWVLAYAVLLVRIRRLRFVEMPALAACSNFAWEAVWSTVLRTDMGRLFEWCYRAWFVLDVLIFWKLLQHGHEQVCHPFVRRHFKAVALAGTLFLAGAYGLFARQGLDDGVGARSAYVAQIAISTLYYLPLLSPERAALLSPAIAWLRTAGTGLITVFVFIHAPHDLFLLFLAGTSLVLDGTFLVVFRTVTRRTLAPQPSPAAAVRHGAPVSY